MRRAVKCFEDDRWIRKPTVEQQVLCCNAHRLCLSQLLKQRARCLLHALFSTIVPMDTIVDGILHATEAISLILRAEKGKGECNERVPIRPA